MLQRPTPVEKICFNGIELYLKRDDKIHADFSGNKARKFHYFLTHDFPGITTLRSYGSSQSNAMYSMSVLAKMKGWRFEYSVSHLSEYLRKNPHGNYRAALENGMQLYVTQTPDMQPKKHILYVEEGGRQKEAAYGIELLAQEIIAWQTQTKTTALNIFLPSGTGTTALFLQKSLYASSPYHTSVYTCPCVGDATYLKKQFLGLEKEEKLHPEILLPEKKHHFGKLYRDNYKIWLELQQQTAVTFDLLYDPLGWRVMLAHPALFERPVMYIHQGGILGNESMLPRYERKYPSVKVPPVSQIH